MATVKSGFSAIRDDVVKLWNVVLGRSRDAPQEAGALASHDDVVGFYNLFLGRQPESDQVVAEKVGKPLISMPADFLRSTEFKQNVFDLYSKTSDWNDNAFFPLTSTFKVWVIRHLNPSHAAAAHVLAATTWHELLLAVLEDGTLLRRHATESMIVESERFLDGLRACIQDADRFVGALDFFDGTTVAGWAYDPVQPGKRAIVELLVAGEIVATTKAADLRSDVGKTGIAPDHCGFKIRLPQIDSELLAAGITARLRRTHRSLTGSPMPVARMTLVDSWLDAADLRIDPAYMAVEQRMPDMFFVRQRQRSAKIAVVIHVFYTETWVEIRDLLSHIEERFDLYVSLVHGRSDDFSDTIIQAFPEAVLAVFPNHGRDVFPFTEFARTGLLDGYDAICKVHSKRSLHRVDGDEWRKSLLSGLLGSPQTVDAICSLLREDPDVGLIVPDGFTYSAEDMGDNLEGVSKLLNRVNLDFNLREMTYPAGNMFWMSPVTVQFIKSLNLTHVDYEIEAGQLDATTGHALERFVGIACTAAAQRMVTTSQALAQNVPRPYRGERHRLIAFYLPQFHPIPENDRWWGKGFTEWHNVQKAEPSYKGHYQPRQPADLGYYDLRIDDVRREQEVLARTHGIDAFCYYHYWFDGKPLLERPVESLIADTQSDFPFCICWANENWTRSWDGLNKDVLLDQSYDPAILPRLATDVLPYLGHSRYLKFDGKPLFLVYKIQAIPDPSAVMEDWRKTWREAGLGEVHIAAVRTFDDQQHPDPAEFGADSFVDFPPASIARYAAPLARNTVPGFAGHIYDYRAVSDADIAHYRDTPTPKVHRGVMGSWDNSARRRLKAHIAHGASPITYHSWLRRSLVQDAANNPECERLTFINAWNEWAEGTYLEPDQRFGHAYLIATRNARGGVEPPKK